MGSIVLINISVSGDPFLIVPAIFKIFWATYSGLMLGLLELSAKNSLIPIIRKTEMG